MVIHIEDFLSFFFKHLFRFSIYIEIFQCVQDIMFIIIKEEVWGKGGGGRTYKVM